MFTSESRGLANWESPNKLIRVHDEKIPLHCLLIDVVWTESLFDASLLKAARRGNSILFAFNTRWPESHEVKFSKINLTTLQKYAMKKMFLWRFAADVWCVQSKFIWTQLKLSSASRSSSDDDKSCVHYITNRERNIAKFYFQSEQLIPYVHQVVFVSALAILISSSSYVRFADRSDFSCRAYRS